MQPAEVAVERAAPASPSHRNGFGLLRLVLASSVIVQHSLALTGHIDKTFLGLWRPASIGDLAVSGFFAVSGYLLLTSARRHPPMRYLRLRFFRLFPGYWAALLAVAFVAAPLASAATGVAYPLTGPESAVSYVTSNVLLIVRQYGIGGILADNPWPEAFNGSLWSLAPEFLCYLVLLAAVVVVRRLGRGTTVVLVSLVTVACTVMALAMPVLGPSGQLLSTLAGLGAAFYSGSLIQHRGWLATPSTRTAVGLWGVVVVLVAVGLWAPVGPPLLAAALVATGRALTSGWASRVDERADLSYGVYLYHFPVIQLLVAASLVPLTVTGALLVVAPLTLLLVLPLAAASWFGVEAPAQRFGRRRRAAL